MHEGGADTTTIAAAIQSAASMHRRRLADQRETTDSVRTTE